MSSCAGHRLNYKNLDRGAGDRRAPSGEKGGDVGYARLEERMAMRLSEIQGPYKHMTKRRMGEFVFHL